MGQRIDGICVTRQWLVVKDHENITVYSLPDLQFQDQVGLRGWHPFRADSDGVIYVPGRSFISMLEISNTGNVSVRGRLTAGGRLANLRSEAVGPQPGQLVAIATDISDYTNTVYIIDIKNDSIIQALALPPGINDVWGVAALGSGQILVAEWGYGNLVWYRSVSEPAVLLTDTPVTGWRDLVMLGNINHFLVAPRLGSQLKVMDSEGGWHTVDALNWETGVWLPGIVDVAVWENCVWVAQCHGILVLLCPV